MTSRRFAIMAAGENSCNEASAIAVIGAKAGSALIACSSIDDESVFFVLAKLKAAAMTQPTTTAVPLDWMEHVSDEQYRR
jgi:hypothetical protein